MRFIYDNYAWVTSYPPYNCFAQNDGVRVNLKQGGLKHEAQQKRECDMKCKVRALMLMLLMCWASQSSAQHTQARNLDFANLRKAEVVTVIMIPIDWSTNPMDENEFKRFGCSFSTTNPTSISNLIKILEIANIQDLNESNYKKVTSRSGIYLSYPNGGETKYLFAPSKNEIQISITDSDVMHETKMGNGEFTQTRKVKRRYVEANNSLFDSLFRWAAEERLVLHGWKEMIESCEREISKYKIE